MHNTLRLCSSSDNILKFMSKAILNIFILICNWWKQTTCISTQLEWNCYSRWEHTHMRVCGYQYLYWSRLIKIISGLSLMNVLCKYHSFKRYKERFISGKKCIDKNPHIQRRGWFILFLTYPTHVAWKYRLFQIFWKYTILVVVAMKAHCLGPMLLISTKSTGKKCKPNQKNLPTNKHQKTNKQNKSNNKIAHKKTKNPEKNKQETLCSSLENYENFYIIEIWSVYLTK